MDPRLWLGIGVILVCSGWTMSYVDDHRMADDVRAQKVGLPDLVAVNAFNLDVHTNYLNEANLIGEVDFAGARLTEAGNDQRFLMLPLYDVSEGGRHAALKGLAEASGQPASSVLHRPVARPPEAAGRQVRVVLVYALQMGESAPGELGDLGLQELGTGFNGRIVHASGALLRQSLWGGADGGVFKAAVSEMVGVERAGAFPLLSPFPKRRTAFAERSELSAIANAQFLMGLVLTALGLVLVAKGPAATGQTASRQPKRRLTVSQAQTQSYLSAFSPIASQEEILADATPAATTQQTSLLDRVADGLGRLAGHASRFRNRR